ncbi:MAG: EamA family transporter [Renibacterium sp.]|nr:EamA family transporter [Renibacterium sp.]
MKPKHALLAVLVALIWGVNFLAINATLQSIPPMLSVALRFLLVIFPLIFFVKPPKVGWRVVVALGMAVNAGQFGLMYLAMHLGLPTGLAPLVLQAQVLLTVLIAMLFVKERPNLGQSIGIGLGIVGLVVVGVGRAQVAPILPFILGLAAALSWSIGNVISRQVLKDSKVGTSGLSLVVWTAAVVPVPMFALSFFLEGPERIGFALSHIALPAVLGALYTAFISTIVGYGIWNYLLGKYSSAVVGPFTLLIPVIGIASAWLVLNEAPTVPELVGGGLLLAGVATAVIRFGRKPRAIPPTAAEPVSAEPAVPAGSR